MIELVNVCKYYKNNAALQDIDIKFNRGEIVGIFGKNGAGKSTLLKSIAGLVKLNKGYINLDGEKIKSKAFEKLSYITEECSLFEKLNAYEHYEFFADFFPKFDKEKYFNLLKFFEIPENKKVGQFSKGQRAKLEIAAGISKNTDFILMDEPFLGKDPFTRRNFIKIMISYFEPNNCILIATHDISDVENFISRVLILDNGKIAADVSMDEINESNKNLLGFISETCGYNENSIPSFMYE